MTNNKIYIKKHIKRVIYSEVPITPEIAKYHWDEMDKEAERLRSQNPCQVISAVSYQDIGGNQIIKFTPTTELIFPSSVPIYDEKGEQIIGENNIRAEIERREEEWARWEREDRLEEHVEIHHTDDGKTVRIKFRTAPKRTHQNESRSFNEWVGGLFKKEEPESKRFKGQVEGNAEQENSSSKLSGKVSGEEDNNKNSSESGKTETQPDTSINREIVNKIKENSNQWKAEELIAKSKNGSKRRDIFLVHNAAFRNSEEINIKEGRRLGLIFLAEDFTNEERAELSQLSGGSQLLDYRSSGSSKLRNEKDYYKIEVPGKQAKGDKPRKDNKGVGVIVAVVGVVSVLAIGVIAFAKRKFSKKK